MTDPVASSAGREGVQAHVRVVRGTPDDVELAALVAGIAAVSSSDEDAPVAPSRSRWAEHGSVLRGAPRATGADAWRWSLR